MLSDLVAHGPGVRLLKAGRGGVDLHSMAVGAGYERRENETYSWEGGRRAPFAVIQHTIAGRGELDYAGTRHALLPGDTMLLNFPHANRYWLAPGQSWEYFWIGLNGKEALRITRFVLDRSGPVLRLGGRYVDLLAGVCQTLIAAEPRSGEASSLAYAATMALYDGTLGGDEAALDDYPLSILRVLSYVDHHLGDPLGVERLARIAGLSRAHFVRTFTVTVGTSPSSYVARQRLHASQRLLTATDATVADIAVECGFADGNYFSKVFRRYMNQSPSEFRAQQSRRD
jgi:AraC-like DNA-binding protein